MTRVLGLGAAALICACLLLPARTAMAVPATTVECGQVITQDTKVANDLAGCSGSGLVIAADNVTLDLNGHTISGDSDSSESEEAGVQVRGVDGAVIKNGTLTGFVQVVNGGDFGPVNGTVIRNVSGDGIFGLVFLVGDGNRVERNSLTGSGNGGLFIVGDGNVIFKSSILGDWDIPVGLEGDGNRITHNLVRAEEHCQLLFDVIGNGNVVRHNDASGGGFCGGASEETASDVECGDVLTQDTTLHSDVVCGGGSQDPLTGVVIAADGITLDLNGFAIRGPNRGEDAEQAGVATSGALNGVTIENGTVDGFSDGLVLDLSDSTIRDVTTDGLLILRGDRNVVRDSVIRNGGHGLLVRGDDNRIVRNGAFGFDGEGIDVRGARNRIVGNTAESFISPAIRVSQFTDVLIRDNMVNSSTAGGIEIVTGSGGVVERNVANDNGSSSGIVVLADDLLIRRNEASRNADHGILALGTGNTIKHNVANDNNPESLVSYGIYAGPGNLDGGGNRARGNGAPEQCFGVRCK